MAPLQHVAMHAPPTVSAPVASVPPHGILLPTGGYFVPGMQPGAILTPGGGVQYILPQVCTKEFLVPPTHTRTVHDVVGI